MCRFYFAIAIGLFVWFGFVPSLASAAAQFVPSRWYVTGEPDHFGDGDTFVASIGARDRQPFGLAVRCIRRHWSLALIDLSFDANPQWSGEFFAIKLRVDRRPVRLTGGERVNARVMEIGVSPAALQDILDGRQLAVRVVAADGMTFDTVFAIGKARQALARHLAACGPVGD
jgi:hypothetical protein